MSQKECVITAISEVINKPKSELKPELRFTEDLGLSSLQMADLIWRLEEVLQLPETPPSKIEGVTTIGDLIEFVDETLGKQAEEQGWSDASKESQRMFDVVFASDHAGVKLKAFLSEQLRKTGFKVADLGPQLSTPVDYPEYAKKVTDMVREGSVRFGVLICGTGIGMSMAANKEEGIRAAVVTDPVSARLTRKHNNANILCLGARIIGEEMALQCLDAFLKARFDPGSDGRHLRRLSLFDKSVAE